MKKWLRIDEGIATLVKYFSSIDPRKSSPIIYVDSDLFAIRSVDDIWMVVMRLKEEYEPMRIPVRIISNYPVGVLVREIQGTLKIKHRGGVDRVELPRLDYLDWGVVKQYMEVDTPLPLPNRIATIFDEKNMLGKKLFKYSTLVSLFVKLDKNPVFTLAYLLEDIIKSNNLFKVMSSADLSNILLMIRSGIRIDPTVYVTFSWLFKRSIKLAIKLMEYFKIDKAYMGFYIDEEKPIEIEGWRIADALVIDVNGIRIINTGLVPMSSIFKRMLMSTGLSRQRKMNGEQ